MNDEIKTDEIKENIRSQDTWLRLLFIVIYSAVLWVASIVLAFVVILQFLSVLLTRSTQSNLLTFGSSLAEFVRQIVAYMTFNTEYKPFPFGDWPTPEGNPVGEAKPKKKKAAPKKKPAADAT